MQKGEKNTI